MDIKYADKGKFGPGHGYLFNNISLVGYLNFHLTCFNFNIMCQEFAFKVSCPSLYIRVQMVTRIHNGVNNDFGLYSE